jgi:hypothetical protein
VTLALVAALCLATFSAVALAAYATHGLRDANARTNELNRLLLHQIVALTSRDASRAVARQPEFQITPQQLMADIEESRQHLDPDSLLIGQPVGMDGGI